MKFLLVSLLISFSYFNSQPESLDCDDLKFNIEVIHTSNGLDNGIIDVTITKSTSKVKVYLYSEGKSANKLNIKLDDLKKLKAGTYMLVLQNDNCYAVKRDIVIR